MTWCRSFIEKHSVEQSSVNWTWECSVLCATWLSHKTHPLREHWRLVALWGRLSANLFCAVNNDERAWALFTSSAQAVKVRSTRSLANVCVGAAQEDEAGWLAAGQASIQNTSVETEQEWKGASGEELGWAFLSQGHNSLPCKHRGKAVDQYPDCSTWAQPELEKGIVQYTSRSAGVALLSSRYCYWIPAKLEIVHHRAVVVWQHIIPKQ